MTARNCQTRPLVGLLIAAISLLAACGGGGESTQTGSNAANTGTSSGAFPVTVQNCGKPLTITEKPQRVVVVGDNAIPLLAAVDALDTVVGLAANPPPPGVYSEATQRAVENMPVFGGEGSGGAAEVSFEAVLGKRPDLVVGNTTSPAMTKQSLARVGIPYLKVPSYCDHNTLTNPTFKDLYSQIRDYGKVFGAQEVAAQTIASLKDRVAAVKKSVEGVSGLSAAVLFQNVASGKPGSYGSDSMATAQLEILGITNVFGDVDERYFEPSIEELISRNPDWLIILHTDGTRKQIKKTFLATPGIGSMKAVRNNNILVMQFAFSNPPTPLSVEGLEIIRDAILQGSG